MKGYRLAHRKAAEYAGVQLGSLLNYKSFVSSLFGDSIKIYFPFSEESGGVAFDTVNESEGVYNSVELNKQGMYSGEKSVLLDSNTDSINLVSDDFSSNFPREEGTFFMWYKASDWSAAETNTLFHCRISSNYEIKLRKENTGTFSLLYRSNGVVTQAVINVDSYGIGRDSWMLVAATFSVTNQEIKILVNGLERKTATNTMVGQADWAPISSAVVGNDHLLTTGFEGNLAHFGVLNKIISTTEFYKLFQNKNAQLVFEGDSRTINSHYETYVLDNISSKYYVDINNAVSGDTVADMADRGGDVDDFIKTGIKNILVVWCGVNSSSLTANEIYTQLRDYCIARQSAGYTVVICTEIDSQGTVTLANDWPTKYLALNTLIKANYTDFADYVADLGADTKLQDATDTTYFQTDKTHLKPTGYEVVAGIVEPVINSIT